MLILTTNFIALFATYIMKHYVYWELVKKLRHYCNKLQTVKYGKGEPNWLQLFMNCT